MAEIQVYSSLTREQALDGHSIRNARLRAAHRKMLPHLVVMPAVHWGFYGRLEQGQLVVHEALQEKFRAIFAGLVELQYPIQNVRPVVVYGWRDRASMLANNTSVYRPDAIGHPASGALAEHTRGSALDLNPFHNPIINPDNSIDPPEAARSLPRLDVVIHRRLDVIALFHEHGFEYGGYWDDPSHPEDYYGVNAAGEQRHILSDRHHFELRPPAAQQLPVPEGLW